MSFLRVLALAGLAALLAPARALASPEPPVQPRLYPVGGRFSLAATVGISVFDTLTRTGTLELRAGWDFSEWLGLDASVTGALAGLSPVAEYRSLAYQQVAVDYVLWYDKNGGNVAAFTG